MDFAKSKPPDENVRRRTSAAILELSPIFDPEKFDRELNSQRAANGSRPSNEDPFQDPQNPKLPIDLDEDTDDVSEQGQEDEQNHRLSLNINKRDGGVDGVRRNSGRYLGQLSDITTSTATDFRSASQAVDITPPENLSPEQLHQLVYRLQSKIQDQQLQLNQSRKALLQERTSKYQGLSDEDLVKRMKILREGVFQWSGAYFTYDGGRYSRSKALHRFRHLVSDYEAYLGSRELRPWLIQARLWDLLQENIFEDRAKYYGFVWAGGVARRRFYTYTSSEERISRNMAPLDTILKPDTETTNRQAWKEYLEWRTLTFNLLCPGGGKNIRPKLSQDEIQLQIELVTNRIWKSLGAYVKADRESPKTSQAKLELRETVKNAMLLDLDFKKQMAEFEVRCFKSSHHSGSVRNQYGFHFEADKMVDVGPASSGKVDTVVSPALFKCQDWSEGTLKGTGAYILKAEVYRRRPPKAGSTQRLVPKPSRQVTVARPKHSSKETSSTRSKLNSPTN